MEHQTILRFATGKCALGAVLLLVQLKAAGALRIIAPPAVRQTGVLTDLAVDGEGYFVVRDPVTDEKFATRIGDFRLDAEGRLVSPVGYRLQGFNVAVRFGVEYPDDATIGDLRLDEGTLPAGLPASVAKAGILTALITSSGKLVILLDDGTAYVRGQVLLQRFQKPSALQRRWLYFFSGFEAAGALSRPSRPNSGKLGGILSGVLDANAPRFRGVNYSILMERLNNQTQLWIPGGSKRTVLQASSDLRRWTSIATNQTLVTDTTADALGSRFYRVLSEVIRQTGIWTDLAINGEGFFLVKNTTNGVVFATRNGHFQVDADGFLITTLGLRIQGYNMPLRQGGDYPSTSIIGDIRVDKGNISQDLFLPVTAARAEVSNVSIDVAGRINVLLDDGSQYFRGQLLLQWFGNPFALTILPDDLLGNLSSAGPLSMPAKPGSSLPGGSPLDWGLGLIESGALEEIPNSLSQ